MAAECTQETILDFLKEKGGKVKNSDLIEHFKAVFPEEPDRKTAVRRTFKNYVDNIAFVKSESGVKYVCLKKKFQEQFNRNITETNGTETELVTLQMLNEEKLVHRYYPTGSDSRQARADDALQDSAPPRAAGGEVHTPGSGYGNYSQVRVPHVFSSATISPDKKDDNGTARELVCIVEEVDSHSGDMGNRDSFKREKRESRKEHVGKAPQIPQISVIGASPLLAEGPMFTLPRPVQTAGQVHAVPPRDRQVDTQSCLKEAEQMNVVTRRRCVSSDDEEDEGQLDLHSLSGSDGNDSPKGSREHFIQVMMRSSPQLRRSMVLRSSVYMSSRSDGDSASLVSSNLDDDRTSITLDPLEHQWMMCASDGEWGSLYQLLATEPSLVLRKDFVTGFTCLHWAAKQGKPELIALIINFAKQHNIPISVDVRSNTGYTPLHIAAMHNHMDVVKLLVGAYSADVEVRDYSGRKACQYLTDNVSVDIRDIIGAYEHSDTKNAECSDGGRWRFSKVLQSNLKPLRLLDPNDCDSVDGEDRPRQKVVRRKSSLSRMKPKLQKLRLRTSQIVHSTTFRDTEELEGSMKASFKSRPKTSFFG
ncbi:LOW QUALITY PROTEIN: ankyrin repeat domain-containing protein SOWAHC-like [Cottoperca gobio]|uniref:LOW QUALITY PROTEIN: ankyrin repeat domain-containing protein SOWAHC-like n=1 Tax=Cottoperca gobio TaxID=56716 RepID=A0A6J2QRK4_COTGO|nr:LOW QUALITY PROTEIN: ankyrin repeat domain-containing protein SOWAHC-like [Cottoperca gobio]